MLNTDSVTTSRRPADFFASSSSRCGTSLCRKRRSVARLSVTASMRLACTSLSARTVSSRPTTEGMMIVIVFFR